MRLRFSSLCLLLTFAVLSCVACAGESSGGGGGGEAGSAAAGSGGTDGGAGGSAGTGTAGSAGSGGVVDSKDCPAAVPYAGEYCAEGFTDSSDCHYDVSCTSGPQRLHFRCQGAAGMYVEPEPCTPNDSCGRGVICDPSGHWRQDDGEACPLSPPTSGEPCEFPMTCFYRCLESDQLASFDCIEGIDDEVWNGSACAE